MTVFLALYHVRLIVMLCWSTVIVSTELGLEEEEQVTPLAGSLSYVLD